MGIPDDQSLGPLETTNDESAWPRWPGRYRATKKRSATGRDQENLKWRGGRSWPSVGPTVFGQATLHSGGLRLCISPLRFRRRVGPAHACSRCPVACASPRRLPCCVTVHLPVCRSVPRRYHSAIPCCGPLSLSRSCAPALAPVLILAHTRLPSLDSIRDSEVELRASSAVSVLEPVTPYRRLCHWRSIVLLSR